VRVITVVSSTSSTSNDSDTAGGNSLLAGTSERNPSLSLAGTNERRSRNYRARASENPLALFAKAERTRRYRRRRRSSTPHLRYGWFERDVERSLELERPPLFEPDEAELERLLAKHADIAEER
jgi:hypothetical protein